ncbi:MAG TPA: 2-hydroxyacid dehydrogenase [Acidobacteriaceae bacterium]
MSRTIRVGIPSLVGESLLKGFPEGVEIVRIDPDGTGPVEVEFLLAPWAQKHAEQVLPRARGVQVVQSFSAGVEGLLPLLPHGVTFCNAQGLHNGPTAEWAVTAILASLKQLPWYAGLQREGRWVTRDEAAAHFNAIYRTDERSELPVLIEELAGKTVLIVGHGAIGRAIETRLAPFEPNILRIARSAREGVSPVSALPTLLPQADVVVLIIPLTPETRGLIDAAALARMKQGALLVNAARGAVVDTDALVSALYESRIRAALDVTDPEPLPPGHALWQAPGLLLTPHVAGSSPVFLKRVMDFTRAQVARYAEGQPLQNIIVGAY